MIRDTATESSQVAASGGVKLLSSIIAGFAIGFQSNRLCVLEIEILVVLIIGAGAEAVVI